MGKKILILGNSGSGKTTTLKYIDNNENVEFLSYDYGKTIIGNDTTYLFSSPGIEGFKFIQDILTQDIDGIIIVIDNTIGITETDIEIINFISEKQIQYVIFANKQDLSNSILKIDFNALIIPTIATEGIGVNDGLKMLLKLIENTVYPNKTLNKGKNITELTKINKDSTIQPKKEFKDIIKELKSMSKKNSQKPDFKHIIAKNKPVKEKDTAPICKLRLLMHPIELENVKNALENAGFSNITTIEVGYIESHTTGKETYRGSRYNTNIPQKIEINMILKREDAKYVIQTIESIKTDDIIDEVFISPIESIMRIRTEERGEEAIE